MSELKPTFLATITVDLDGDDDPAEQLDNVRDYLDQALTAMVDDGVIIDCKLTLEGA